MKLLFDFFPILLFFIAYKFGGIYVATTTAIVATILQLLYAKFVMKKVEPMMWASAVIVTIFGGLTLALHNPTFIKWKPTVLYWSMGSALAISALVVKRNLIRHVMSEQVTLPESVWGRLNAAWIVFFTCMGILNLVVAFNFDEATWVNFKLFGGMGLMFLFVLGQAFFISRYVQEDSKSGR